MRLATSPLILQAGRDEKETKLKDFVGAHLAARTAKEIEASSNGYTLVVRAPDSPAAKAGLLPRDLITRFAGKPVASARALTRQIAQTPIDTSVEVEVLRKAKRSVLTVKVGRLVDPGGERRRIQADNAAETANEMAFGNSQFVGSKIGKSRISPGGGMAG